MTLSHPKNYQSSLAIKVRFPNQRTQSLWTIEEQTKKTTYAVPFLAVLICVFCVQKLSKEKLFKLINSKISVNKQVFEKTLESLVQRKIIFSESHFDSMLEDIKNWKASGWGDAAEYHFYTWDAPFLDYSKEGNGHEIDREKMRHFQKQQADTFRCKKYDKSKKRIPLPSIKNLSVNEIECMSVKDRLKFLLACVFTKIGEKACHWTKIPLVRRTSPSGGCRHPSEGYFAPSKYLKMEKGCYHVQIDPAELCLLNTQFDHSSLIASTEEVNSCNYLGAIIISTIFERNMYRYREPRTFRTVHMDVGHILASINLLCGELGFRSTPYLQFGEENILNIIGASKLKEGIMAMLVLSQNKPF